MDTDHVFRTKLHDRGAYVVLMVAALLVVAFVGVNLLAGRRGGEEKGRIALSVSLPPAASATPRPSPSQTSSVASPDGGYLTVGRNS